MHEPKEEEMVRYRQILQNLFGVFWEQGIKLSGGWSFDATRLVAIAILRAEVELVISER